MEIEKIVPKLNLNYTTETNGGIKVRGHETRCNALKECWESMFQVSNDLPPIIVADHMYDSFYYKDKKRINDNGLFSVEITDIPYPSFTNNSSVNIVINHNIGAENVDHSGFRAWNNAKFLLGTNYFIDYQIFGLIEKKKTEEIGKNVLILPGGNIDKFLSKININLIVSESDRVSICTNLTHDDLVDEFFDSDLVITTPSMSAMEALSFELPVLLVKTSDDQTGKFVEEGYAVWYTDEIFDFFIDNIKRIDKMFEGKRISSHVNKVCQIIYDEWRWSENNEI